MDYFNLAAKRVCIVYRFQFDEAFTDWVLQCQTRRIALFLEPIKLEVDTATATSLVCRCVF